MRSKRFRHSVRKYGKRLSRLCAALAPEFGEEPVHRIRMTVKKFRALLRCWGQKGRRGLTADFKELYRILGELRNTQLFLRRLRGKPPELAAWAREHAAALENRWHALYDPSIVRRQAKAVEYPPRSRKKRLKAFLKKERSGISRLLRERPLADETVHSIRKALKDMQYTMRRTPEALKRLTDEAGRFVDSRTYVALVNEGITEGVNTPAVSRLRDDLEQAKFRRKKQVVQAFTRWQP